MTLDRLTPPIGAVRKRKRVGRGSASGVGKTAGRGEKGQKSRTGKSLRGFEGGQMPLQRRLPKRGFTNLFRTEYEVVNVMDLARFEAGSTVDVEILQGAGLVRRHGTVLVKVLGDGEIDRPLKVRAHRFSETARRKIEAAGGTTEVI